jgi:Protein of unknown function (DUF3417)
MQNTHALARLALDLRRSLNDSADEIWKKLDPELWELTVNPWPILQAISPQKPVVAVGLLYQQGYFRQEADADGNQQALYPVNEPGQLPTLPVRTKDGERLWMAATFPRGTVWIRTWEVQVRRRRLYLLDTNDPANPPNVRAICTAAGPSCVSSRSCCSACSAGASCACSASRRTSAT